jgi:hypothetical protein
VAGSAFEKRLGGAGREGKRGVGRGWLRCRVNRGRRRAWATQVKLADEGDRGEAGAGDNGRCAEER